MLLGTSQLKNLKQHFDWGGGPSLVTPLIWSWFKSFFSSK